LSIVDLTDITKNIGTSNVINSAMLGFITAFNGFPLKSSICRNIFLMLLSPEKRSINDKAFKLGKINGIKIVK
jgi:Pyruvate/2-oxoacid:ferredoxin oxidoreductase gamma subunit